MNAPTFLILFICFAAVMLADDFKTLDGKEYKNVTVSRVETDGILVKTKSGISKIYFTELPKDVQERFHYDPEKAAATTADQQAAIQQANELARQADEIDKQRRNEQQRQSAELQAKQGNIQALTDQLNELQVQEQNLLAQIGQAERAQTDARRRWIDSRGTTQYSDPKEAQLPLLKGQLENVRDEKKRVRQELKQAQRQH